MLDIASFLSKKHTYQNAPCFLPPFNSPVAATALLLASGISVQGEQAFYKERAGSHHDNDGFVCRGHLKIPTIWNPVDVRGIKYGAQSH